MSEVFYDWYSIGRANGLAKRAAQLEEVISIQKETIEGYKESVQSLEKAIENKDKVIHTLEQSVRNMDELVEDMATHIGKLIAVAQEHANAYVDERAARTVLINLMRVALPENQFNLIMKVYKGDAFSELFMQERAEILDGLKNHWATLNPREQEVELEELKEDVYPPISILRNAKFTKGVYENEWYDVESIKEGEQAYRERNKKAGKILRDENYQGEVMIENMKERTLGL